ncbi:MAG: DUF1232 domain-containing protein [Clostridia bacterium]|nr:DUF1232 domain-containing protein [Clostridia bacterium]
MQFIGLRVILRRIKAIRFMMADKSVPKRKKALIIFGLIYLVLPVDLIPPVIFPIGFLDDLILWLWILIHLRDELDKYWLGEKPDDLSKKYKNKDIIEDASYEVKHEDVREAGEERGAGTTNAAENAENAKTAEGTRSAENSAD